MFCILYSIIHSQTFSKLCSILNTVHTAPRDQIFIFIMWLLNMWYINSWYESYSYSYFQLGCTYNDSPRHSNSVKRSDVTRNRFEWELGENKVI